MILWIELIIFYIISNNWILGVSNDNLLQSIYSIYIISLSGLETSIYLLILTLI